MPHINRRIPDLGHEKKLPKEKPEDYKINPLQSLFRPPHLSNDPKVREGGIHTGHKYGPINLSWKGPNTKFWSGVPGYLMGLPSQEQIDEATTLRGQKKLDASKISKIPSTFDQAFSQNAAKGNEFTYSLEEAQAAALKDVSKTNDETLNELSTTVKEEVGEVVDPSDDTKTVVENQEKAQSEDAPGSDADLEKERQANLDEQISAGLKTRETTFGPEGIETEIKDAPQDKTDQPNPNAAQQNFDKIAGAIHGLATIAKALDTGEYTPPRIPSSWEGVGSKLAEASTVDPDDDKKRYGIPRYG